MVASELARTVLVKNFNCRIRSEAAKALVHVSPAPWLSMTRYRPRTDVQLDTPDAQYMGSFLLLKLLDHLRPKGKNDFSDIAEYLVLRVSPNFTF